ncbi:MAG: penicillin-binding protein 1A [Rhodospirillales bacterium]|nr:penicillin-binding protein 1A [Rhodospirillales bacterium]MBO6785836.1 penicillin-binding protein 1A [Rhodospirillales bacterium]
MKFLLHFTLITLSLLVLASAAVGGGALYVLHTFGRDLPDYRQLATYDPQVMTRVHAGDGRLLAEFAIEKRAFVPIEAMPRRIIDAFLSAEDKSFYSHSGIDYTGVARAVVTNLQNVATGRRLVGASTITQQVAKNFLLTNEVSFDRKIKEAILAIRIERAFTKNKILELYLNEIYLGYGSYGVAAAALNYFNKSLNELSIAEAAYLAALPKAPNNYNPVSKHQAAKARRNWVVGRMLDDGRVTPDEAREAQEAPLLVARREETEFVQADYFTEEVRRELVDRFGEDQLYQGGLSVRTTLDPKLQAVARDVLRRGLEAYDRRHGYRGPVTTAPAGQRLDTPLDWRTYLGSITRPKGMGEKQLAIVIGVDDAQAYAQIGVEDGKAGIIPLDELKWAREALEHPKRGPAIKKPSDVLTAGDVVMVEPVQPDPKNKDKASAANIYSLQQIPDVNGGIIAIDPHTGRVLAMVGGYSFDRSQFNRATQAARQPGSAFKPFVYLAGLDMGFTPATRILDAPFVIDQGPGLPKWRPANYGKKFYGASTMRLGIEKSRNLMTVRLAQTIGMERVAEYAERFGIVDDLPETLAMALGAAETTLIRLTTAYAMLVNGGKKITPTLIDRVQDRLGRSVFRHDKRECPDCRADAWHGQRVPEVPDTRPQITDPTSAYQVVSMLKGVVERGTGRRISEVGKPLAGKTGTTNEERDTWFMGFAPDLAVGVFVGYDEPIPLGRHETGSSVAAPVFRDFMKAALADQPATPFRTPPGIRLVRVNARTGLPIGPGDSNVILEAFKEGTVPDSTTSVIEGQGWSEPGSPENFTSAPLSGTGGLY